MCTTRTLVCVFLNWKSGFGELKVGFDEKEKEEKALW